MSSDNAYGRLWVVGAPLGHPDDITLRALAVLQNVSFVAAEDARRADSLLKHHDLRVPVLRCRGDDQAERVERILSSLASGADVAYLSEAGSSGASQAAGLLVNAAVAAGFQVVPLPGPSAVAAAISICGLGARGYHFLGFLPRGKSKRSDELRAFLQSPWPIVLLESPRRVHDLLSDARDTLGDRTAMAWEEGSENEASVLHGRLSDIAEGLPRVPRGTITLVIAGTSKEDATRKIGEPWPVGGIAERACQLAAEGRTRPQIARQLVKESAGAVTRSEAYAIAVKAVPTQRVFRFEARGHDCVRATHGKTLEFKRASTLSLRETCVVGVAASWDAIEVKKLRGRVEVTLAVAGNPPLVDRFESDINLRFCSAERIVFRKSRHRCPATLGIGATKAAADLDRALITRLQDADSPVEVAIRCLS